jgi:hypothetical protein
MDPRHNLWVFGRSQTSIHSRQLNQAPGYPLVQGGIGGIYPNMYQFAFPAGHKDRTRDSEKKIKDHDAPVLPTAKTVTSTSALSQRGKGKGDRDDLEDEEFSSDGSIAKVHNVVNKDDIAMDKNSTKDKNNAKNKNSEESGGPQELSNFADLEMTPETFQKKLEDTLKRPFKSTTVEKKSPPKKKKKSSFLMVT